MLKHSQTLAKKVQMQKFSLIMNIIKEFLPSNNVEKSSHSARHVEKITQTKSGRK